MNKFQELAKAKINPSKNIVISRNLVRGGFAIAQQLIVKDGFKTLPIFLQGAIAIESLEGLYELRDAINEALNVAEHTQD